MWRIIIPLFVVAYGYISVLPSFAAKRALVIGIDRYEHLALEHQLQRAVNDAKSVAVEFERLGYDVLLSVNPSRAQFNEVWQSFVERIERGDQVAVFFAGHGVEINSQNFLLPRDIPFVRAGRQEQLRREALNVSEFLLDLRAKKPQVSLLVLDACRNSPFGMQEGRSLASAVGLAGIKDPPEGTFIMYSAGAGETALDRLPDEDPTIPNSVYTRRLLPLLRTPGLTMPEMAQRLRAEVRELAGRIQHVQTPAYYDGLIGQYCLSTCEKPALVAAMAIDPSRAEDHAWATAVVAANIPAFTKYLELYPNGRHSAEARSKITNITSDMAKARDTETERRRVAALEDDHRRTAASQDAADALDWTRAQSVNQLDSYKEYLLKQPTGRHIEAARAQVRAREALHSTWQQIRSDRNLVRLKQFVEQARSTEFGAAASVRLDELEALENLAWREADRSRMLAGYEAFLVAWPGGFFAAMAREKLNELGEIRQQWSALRSSEDEARLEAFVHAHGWSEFGAEAIARTRRAAARTGDTGYQHAEDVEGGRVARVAIGRADPLHQVRRGDLDVVDCHARLSNAAWSRFSQEDDEG